MAFYNENFNTEFDNFSLPENENKVNSANQSSVSYLQNN